MASGESDVGVSVDQHEAESKPVATSKTRDGWSPELVQLLESKWAEIEEDSIKLLQKLIQTDTQNLREDGSETLAALVIKEKFDDVGISYEMVEGRENRANIVARIPGDGSSSLGAIMLSSHLDTVRAPKENWEEEGWKHNPFGGEIDEEDGCLYGRGAVDMKQMAAMSVIILCFVKKSGIVLSRDLIFAGVADEERTDSKWGAKYLIENRPELIEADVIFNEIGGFSMFLDNQEVFPLQIGEKGSVQIKITARGPGGHGSLYHKENPIATIGEAAHKLHTHHLPLRINIANTATIESLANVLPFPKSMVFRRLLSPTFSDLIMSRLLTEEQRSTLGPLLHNTANPTGIAGGGEQHNQIPTSASLKVDGRILPESTSDDVLDDIKGVLGRELFEPQSGPDGQELPPIMTMEVLNERGPCFQDPSTKDCQEVITTIREVIKNRADGASIVNAIIPGGTDFYWYMKHPTKKPICLGFTPVRFDRDLKFSTLFHGTNERIPVEGFKWGVRTLTEVVYKLCAAKLE